LMLSGCGPATGPSLFVFFIIVPFSFWICFGFHVQFPSTYCGESARVKDRVVSPFRPLGPWVPA
jgi:hypothetical protein